jgi:nitrate reductase delta subunit
MLGTVKKSPEHLRALDRVKEWTRERFQLAEQDAILVSELACAVPGCPPLETVVAFWPADGKRRHFKLFKPVEEVASDDLPYDWLIDALIVPDGVGCDCC